ncbi:hypothetical protein ACQPYK_31060 [Streptosporangium sp. CA-135522]|uniref:hypothetical protein n=1 Tax=Streptosporangium sp. CA-135522 TaxID=3240072 RepID=UPI003D8F3FDE
MTTSTHPLTTTRPSGLRRRTGRLLAGTAALLALLAGLSSGIAEVTAAGDATLMIQTWRMYGLLLFAGLFALLAWRPEGNGPLWALVIADKAAVSLTAVVYVVRGDVAQAGTTVGWDGAITVMLIVAFFLCRPSGSKSDPPR